MYPTRIIINSHPDKRKDRRNKKLILIHTLMEHRKKTIENLQEKNSLFMLTVSISPPPKKMDQAKLSIFPTISYFLGYQRETMLPFHVFHQRKQGDFLSN